MPEWITKKLYKTEGDETLAEYKVRVTSDIDRARKRLLNEYMQIRAKGPHRGQWYMIGTVVCIYFSAEDPFCKDILHYLAAHGWSAPQKANAIF